MKKFYNGVLIMLNNACFTPFPNLCHFKMLDSIYWHFFQKQGKWKRCGSGSARSLTPSELDLHCFQDMIYWVLVLITVHEIFILDIIFFKNHCLVMWSPIGCTQIRTDKMLVKIWIQTV